MIQLIYIFSFMIIISLIIALILKFFKQPVMIAYILSGMIIAYFSLIYPKNIEIFSLFSQFGIAFLLFIVGLSLNPRVLKQVNKVSIFAGTLQIIFTFVFAFLLSITLGFNKIFSLYIASALTFSSTIIVTKILSDKQEIDSLYGKISVGILILQDLAVLLLLALIQNFKNNNFLLAEFIFFSLALFIFIILMSLYILPKITRFIAKNQELLFLFSISWCFFLASIFYKLNLGMEIGALIAGISLSVSPYSIEISSKVKSLRDFFLIIFFINLGLQLTNISSYRVFIFAIIFSLFTIIFKFLIISIALGSLGYTKRTSFFTAISLTQISEFSFIIIAIGLSLNQISSEISSIIILTGVFTIFISTYLMYFCDKIYLKISKYLSIFEKKGIKEESSKEKKEYDYVLLGYNRTGFSLLKSLIKLNKTFVVIDYDPTVINRLKQKKISCIYGDASDVEMLDEINIEKAKLIISTIPETNSTILLINKIKNKNKDTIIIVTARQINEAIEFYKLGADYVILPHFLGGKSTAELIERAKTNKKIYEEEKIKQIKELKERLLEGQEHPNIERD